MLKLVAFIQNFLTAPVSEDRGATAVEYGLMVALIAAVIVVVVGLLGQQVSTAFSTVLAAM